MEDKLETSRLLKDWISDKTFYQEKNLTDTQQLYSVADRQTLELFHQVQRRVPAYKDFLTSQKIKGDTIKTINDLSLVPPTTKENYIEKYNVRDRSWDGKLNGMTMISTSSGTTGQSHLWPRNLSHEIDGAKIHELIFESIFGGIKEPTLLIDGFAMGNWIAGTFTLACSQLVSLKGYPLTTMTPGYSVDQVVETLERVAPLFGKTILTGHTPFLKEVIEQALARKIPLHKLDLRFLGTGQAITEKWRSYILDLLGGKDYYHTFINLYGSADASLMGFETPQSIFIRENIVKENLNQQIFNDERVPSLYNFDPRLIYFQSLDGQLLITKNTGAPLIRYNIKDEGGILSANELKISLPLKQKPGINFDWQLPFVYLFGREKFMVKLYGANIYTEHVQLALDQKELQKILTGRFKIECVYDEKQNPTLVCHVELNKGVGHDDKYIQEITRVFVKEVSLVNKEYHFLLTELGKKMEPKIVLHAHGDPQFFPTGTIKKTA